MAYDLFLNNATNTWRANLSQIIALSTAESELMALASCWGEIVKFWEVIFFTVTHDLKNSEKLVSSLFHKISHQNHAWSVAWSVVRSFLFAVPAANFRKRYISSSSEIAFPGGFGDSFGSWTPSKKSFFGTQKLTCFLSMVSSQPRAMRTETSLGMVIFILRVLTYVISYKLFWN